MHNTVPKNKVTPLRPFCMVSPGEVFYRNRQLVLASALSGFPFVNFRPTDKVYPSASECNRPAAF